MTLAKLLISSCVLMTICLQVCDGMPTYVISAEEQAQQDAQVYLTQYGYLSQQSYRAGTAGTDRDLTFALTTFQQMTGIPQTGILDTATQGEMDRPRCGVPDIGEYSTTQAKFEFHSLTYRIDAFTRDLSRDTVRQEIAKAWQVWVDVTPLTFSEVAANEEADFVIIFGSGDHGDNYPFDGRSGVLAHAFFPRNGRVHFDEDEPWTVGTHSGINLFVVAVHEFGHALGLKHSSVRGSIMNGGYSGYQGANFRLASDDIEGIQSLYGPPNDDDGTDVGPPVSACNGQFETVFKTADDKLYGFTNGHVWDLTNRLTNGISLVYGGTRSIFHSMISPQAAVTLNRKTYIFHGCSVSEFVNEEFQHEHQIPDLWERLPCNVDAVYKADDGFTYFFFNLAQYSRQYVYKFEGFTRRWQGFASSLGWNGFPTDLTTIDAISSSGNTNNDVYIFSNTRYWKLNQRSKTFYRGYPRDTVTNWLSNCSV